MLSGLLFTVVSSFLETVVISLLFAAMICLVVRSTYIAANQKQLGLSGATCTAWKCSCINSPRTAGIPCPADPRTDHAAGGVH